LSIVAGVAGLALATGCTDTGEPSVQARATRHPGYHVLKLRGLDGKVGSGNGITNLGWVTGVSSSSDNTAAHATAWVFGFPFDLGIVGTNSAMVWPVKNTRGVLSGIIEVPGDDPNDEAWSCAAFIPKSPGHVCRGFVWEDGELRTLPTLGGTHGFATGTNNHRQTVGWAETTVRDPTCNQVDQFLQFRAVVWERDRVRELRPLGEDSTSAATAINDHGQVVGISGACANAVGGASAAHAVIWEPDGTVTDLGSFGGIAWNTPMALNDHGDVVGFANGAATEPPLRFNYRPFLWTRQQRRMTDLGTLPGDSRGQALGINARRQVVGFSRGISLRGVIWDNGTVADLNTLIVSGSRDTITIASDINDLGMITGTAVAADGASSSFLAIPIGRP
jgi:uncharacterized membrane protein